MQERIRLGEEFSPRREPIEAACPAFSLVLPVYNEEEAIAFTLDHLQETLRYTDCEYEIVAVNDGSKDGTGEILRSRSDIKLIEHRRNRGYGAALKTGIRNAKYPLIVITDADGTYPNERIPELVRLAARADMVVGARIGANVDSGFSTTECGNNHPTGNQKAGSTDKKSDRTTSTLLLKEEQPNPHRRYSQRQYRLTAQNKEDSYGKPPHPIERRCQNRP